MPTDLSDKYSRIAAGFAERSYANLSFYMDRRFAVAMTWGRALSSTDSVLDLGCGDGYLGRLFAAHGLRYCGVDTSTGMVASARRRLSEAGLKSEFRIADVNQIILSEPIDAVVSYMRSFFAYVDNPLAVAKRFRPFIRKKMILDLDPRHMPRRAAVKILQEAGFAKVEWRPFFVPQQKNLPPPVLRTLVTCEKIPGLRTLPLRWKFLVLIKGEIS